MSVAGAHVEARIGDADVGPDGRVVDLEATLGPHRAELEAVCRELQAMLLDVSG